MTLEFFISLDKIKGIGKNNIGITRNGIRYPKKSFKEFRNYLISEILNILMHKYRNFTTFETPVALTVYLFQNDRRNRDIPAILDAVCHILEKSGIIKDDGLVFKSVCEKCFAEKEKGAIYIKVEKLDYDSNTNFINKYFCV